MAIATTIGITKEETIVFNNSTESASTTISTVELATFTPTDYNKLLKDLQTKNSVESYSKIKNTLDVSRANSLAKIYDKFTQFKAAACSDNVKIPTNTLSEFESSLSKELVLSTVC